MRTTATKMKLKDIATVFEGLRITASALRREKSTDGNYIQYLRASDFADGLSYFVSQKELRKIADHYSRHFLSYGDYILYKKDSEFKLLRYDDISGQTIPGEGLFIIRADIGILKDFLDYKKNTQYFCREVKDLDQNGQLTIQGLNEIEIGTENILELETANKAEEIGIRKPIDISGTPIKLTQKPLPADKLIKRIDNNELRLDTEFQRRPGLWDISVKSRLIESMIIRLPIPAFYFDGSDDDNWLIIDGLQRISAINDFIKGSFALTDLDYLPGLQDKFFTDLERRHQRNIEEYEIFAYIIEKGTPKSVTYKIFKNINTSALKLEPQEIRHAINPGSPADFLRRIASEGWFSEALTLTPRQKDRMDDRETALRFIAFNRTKYTEFKGRFVDFLDNAMTDIYDIPLKKQDAYLEDLKNIVNVLYAIFGEKCFSRSLFDTSRNYGHNNIMFELLTYGMSLIPPEKRSKLKEQSSGFKELIISHFSEKPDQYWEYEIAYTADGLKRRFEEIEILFKKIGR